MMRTSGDLIDPGGTPLTPSHHGKDCLGNGELSEEDADFHYDMMMDETLKTFRTNYLRSHRRRTPKGEQYERSFVSRPYYPQALQP